MERAGRIVAARLQRAAMAISQAARDCDGRVGGSAPGTASPYQGGAARPIRRGQQVIDSAGGHGLSSGGMKCLVTAGPTWEPLDEVRRLTNFSTGRLGSELANFLVERGLEVTLLLGAGAIYRGRQQAQHLETFTTTVDLRDRLQRRAGAVVRAVFHAAAVSDFTIGKVWKRAADGRLVAVHSAKLSTRDGVLLAELAPTPKLIAGLRGWFPRARLIGWKQEVSGTRQAALARAAEQIRANRTDACVLNGRAYGTGFGLVTGAGRCVDLADSAALYGALAAFIGA